MGNRIASGYDGHGDLSPAPDASQVTPKSRDSQCISATGSFRTGRIWVRLSVEKVPVFPFAKLYRAMKLGQCARDIFPKTHTLEQSSGATFYTLGFLVALILWAFGLVWLFFASASIVYSRTFPFNIGWWGFTFPLGVFAASTVQMGAELPSGFFNVLGTVSKFCSLV